MDRGGRMVGTGIIGAPAGGDVMKLQNEVGEGVITDAKFRTYGRGSAIASSSLVTEWVKGMKVEEALKLKNGQIDEELSLLPAKTHGSVLAEYAIKAAIADYQKKSDGSSALTDPSPTGGRTLPQTTRSPNSDSRRAFPGNP